MSGPCSCGDRQAALSGCRSTHGPHKSASPSLQLRERTSWRFRTQPIDHLLTWHSMGHDARYIAQPSGRYHGLDGEPLAWQTLGLQGGLSRPVEKLFDAAKLSLAASCRRHAVRCRLTPGIPRNQPKFRSSLTLPRPTRNTRMWSSSKYDPASQPWCTSS